MSAAWAATKGGLLYSVARIKDFFGRLQGNRPATKKLNPLVIRIPLFDPDRLLNYLVVFVRPLFTPAALVVWALTVTIAGMLAVINLPSLTAAFNRDLLQPENLFGLVMLYVGVKLVHEFSHAFALKIWGGEVHGMGV